MGELFQAAEDVPEYYVDSIRIGLGPYGFILDLGVQGIPDTPVSEPPHIKRQAIIRMSPQHALIFSKLLQKNVAIYQAQVGPITLPDEMYRQLDIEPDTGKGE